MWSYNVTVPFETGFDNARERKETKYEELVLSARNNGYETTLLTLEVGARGVPSMPGFKKLQHTQSDKPPIKVTSCKLCTDGHRGFVFNMDKQKQAVRVTHQSVNVVVFCLLSQ